METGVPEITFKYTYGTFVTGETFLSIRFLIEVGEGIDACIKCHFSSSSFFFYTLLLKISILLSRDAGTLLFLVPVAVL